MIKYYDRKTNTYEVEKVAGESYLNWTYSSPLGMKLLESFIKKKLFSKLYGAYCNSAWSRKKITHFIKDFELNAADFEDTPEAFTCFNDFFARRLKAGVRPIAKEENAFISPGDGRLLAYENINLDKLVQVKGFTYSLKDLISNNTLAQRYEKGTCLILRLCPTDYHRFHFIDEGACGETTKIKGHYYSVNPVALEKVPHLFCQNKREWSIFHSEHFGDVLYVEVGATCVGSIIQTYSPNQAVSKGDEKGYFKFGGSTVILFLEAGKVKMDEDILRQSNLHYETKVLFGEKIGIKLNNSHLG